VFLKNLQKKERTKTIYKYSFRKEKPDLLFSKRKTKEVNNRKNKKESESCDEEREKKLAA